MKTLLLNNEIFWVAYTLLPLIQHPNWPERPERSCLWPARSQSPGHLQGENRRRLGASPPHTGSPPSSSSGCATPGSHGTVEHSEMVADVHRISSGVHSGWFKAYPTWHPLFSLQRDRRPGLACVSPLDWDIGRHSRRKIHREYPGPRTLTLECVKEKKLFLLNNGHRCLSWFNGISAPCRHY